MKSMYIKDLYCKHDKNLTIDFFNNLKPTKIEELYKSCSELKINTDYYIRSYLKTYIFDDGCYKRKYIGNCNFYSIIALGNINGKKVILKITANNRYYNFIEI